MTPRWKVVYTKHKAQKRKVWQDGFLDVTKRKVFLFAEENGKPSKAAIDEMFLGSNIVVESGSIIELPGFLVDPDAVISEDQQLPISLKQKDFEVSPKVAIHEAVMKKSNVLGRTKRRASETYFSSISVQMGISKQSKSALALSNPYKRCSGSSSVEKPTFLGVKSSLLHLMRLVNDPQTFKRKNSTMSFPIPDKFSNLNEYLSVFFSAVLIEFNAMLMETSLSFCHQYWRITNISDSPFTDMQNDSQIWIRCPQHSTLCVPSQSAKKPGQFEIQCPLTKCSVKYTKDSISSRRDTQSNIAIPVTCYEKRALVFQNAGLLYYIGCRLIRQFSKNSGSRDICKMRLFLMLPEKRARSSAFSLYDCWIVSSSSSFEREDPNFWIFIAYAKYHGPTKSGVLELQILPGSQIPSAVKSQGAHENVFAMMAGNAQSEVLMLLHMDSLKSSPKSSHHLLKYLQNPCHTDASFKPRLQYHVGLDMIEDHFDFICNDFSLNSEQKDALKHVKGWILPLSDHREPVILVHGVFGSGKSHLLAAIVMFLSKIISDRSRSEVIHRVLIASLTNVAVDRILLCLKDHGFSDFARVGSLKKIAKPILKHVLHWSEHSGDQEESDKQALATYREMLNDPEIAPSDRLYVNEAYEELLAERAQKRAEKLKSMPVVGVTCASSIVDALSGSEFDVVILDECSQIAEPMSLLPLTSFKSQFAILVGDPVQLPPTLRSMPDSGIGNSSGLAKTLFVRLHRAGINPIVLNRQYRCHPVLSRICSELFYDDNLKNGCSADDRGAIVPGLPPISFIDASDSSSHCMGSGGSLYNPVETRIVSQVLKQIFSTIDNECFTVGVIALYKSQESHLKSALGQLPGNVQVQVSTVDAFQGSEKDVIILSTVRSSGIGFINCPRRLNVALSRAKRHMIVIGSSSALSRDNLWRNVIEYAAWVAGRSPPYQFNHAPEIRRNSSPAPFVFNRAADVLLLPSMSLLTNANKQEAYPNSDQEVSIPKNTQMHDNRRSPACTKDDSDPWSWVNDVQLDVPAQHSDVKGCQSSSISMNDFNEGDIDNLFALQ